LSVADVRNQIAQVQSLMKSTFQDGTHFGKIPGCGDKPTLLKAGAEKIGFMFKLAPSIEIREEKHQGSEHRTYQVTVTLTHTPSGNIVGQGVGICSTLESKYRFRWDATGESVPEAYWEARDSDLIGGPSYTARKSGGKWQVHRKVEHDNPADYYNTCLKMGKKRAQVDACLSAVACSDIFTQDIEDAPVKPQAAPAQTQRAPEPAPQPPPAAPVPAATPESGDAWEGFDEAAPAAPVAPPAHTGWQADVISEGQRRRLYAISKGQEANGRHPNAVKKYISDNYGLNSTNDIKRGDYDAIVTWVETGR
jgi:hypothetical protein